MAYQSIWCTLPEALERVMAATGGTEPEVKADVSRAIADRAISIRCKLDKQHPPGSMNSDAVLTGDDFDIPHEIKPERLDWVSSRPLEPWPVRRGRYKIPGLWHLDWINLLSRDVTEHLCRRDGQSEAVQGALSHAGAAIRSQPARERASQAIGELYPRGVPAQATEPNHFLYRRVRRWLGERGFRDVSDETILRAAGRRD
jgi:hypothetical protein